MLGKLFDLFAVPEPEPAPVEIKPPMGQQEPYIAYIMDVGWGELRHENGYHYFRPEGHHFTLCFSQLYPWMRAEFEGIERH